MIGDEGSTCTRASIHSSRHGRQVGSALSHMLTSAETVRPLVELERVIAQCVAKSSDAGDSVPFLRFDRICDTFFGDGQSDVENTDPNPNLNANANINRHPNLNTNPNSNSNTTNPHPNPNANVAAVFEAGTLRPRA